MTDRLAKTHALIDAANAADPTQEGGQPAALLYGERMTAELAYLVPAASEVLQIAARGQHVERWLLPRSDYPAGKTGYLDWRREQARRHAARVGASLLHAAGCDEFLASTPAQFAEIAAGLANDHARLAARRSGLRARLSASPLLDQQGYATRFHAALRECWREHCRTATR